MEMDYGIIENLVIKGENAGNQYFLLFPLCFQKASFPGLLKNRIVCGKVSTILGIHFGPLSCRLTYMACVNNVVLFYMPFYPNYFQTITWVNQAFVISFWSRFLIKKKTCISHLAILLHMCSKQFSLYV